MNVPHVDFTGALLGQFVVNRRAGTETNFVQRGTDTVVGEQATLRAGDGDTIARGVGPAIFTADWPFLTNVLDVVGVLGLEQIRQGVSGRFAVFQINVQFNPHVTHALEDQAVVTRAAIVLAPVPRGRASGGDFTFDPPWADVGHVAIDQVV